MNFYNRSWFSPCQHSVRKIDRLPKVRDLKRQLKIFLLISSGTTYEENAEKEITVGFHMTVEMFQ